MLTGTITKVHDDRSGFVRGIDGSRYRFYPNHLWDFTHAAPKAGDEVVFEPNSTGRSAKGMRRLKGPGIGVVSEQRWVPTRITSKGVASNRYASTLYLTLAQVASNKLEDGSIVMVRQKHTYQQLAEALELKPVPTEEAAEIAIALVAKEAAAAECIREADAQLLALGQIDSVEHLKAALRLLRLRDAYGSAPGKPVLKAALEIARQLRALGYANWLSEGSMFGLRLAEEPNLRADQLIGGLFDLYVIKRLGELKGVSTDEENHEVLELHRLSKHKGSKVFTPELIKNFELSEACQLGLWQQGFAIALPHTRLDPAPLQIGLFEQYVGKRLTELNPIETAEAEQELLRLVELSQLKRSTIFSAELLAGLSMSEGCQVALWQQGAKIDLPHTRLDPSSLTDDLLRQYVSRRMAELNPIDTVEACEEVLRLYQLSKQQQLEIFTSSLLTGIGMDGACQLQLWLAGMAVALPHTQLDPQELTSSQFQEYAQRRLEELNPIDSMAKAEELVALYELSTWKQSVEQVTRLLWATSAAEAHRLSLWQAGIDVFIPSTEELAHSVLTLVATDGDSRAASLLMTRCERRGIAAEVATEVLAHTPDESLLAVLQQLQPPRMTAAYGAALATALEKRSAEELLLQWWLDGTLRVAPAGMVARRILAVEGEEQLVLLRKFRKQEGSALAMVEVLKEQMRKGKLEPGAYLLLERQAAIVREQGRSTWNVDYWALAVIRGLAHEAVSLPAAEQVEWWLQGLGTEPQTSVLREVAPQLQGESLTRMWKALSTEGLKALVPALLPGLARPGTGQWVLLTLTALSARRGAFYNQACDWIREKSLPYLTAEELADLWLGGCISQPSDEKLWPLMQTGAETIIPLLSKLSASSLVHLLPACLKSLSIESAITPVVLEQLTKHENTHVGCSGLKQELLAQLLPAVQDSLYLEWWKSGWVPAPSVEQLSHALPMLPPEQRQALLRRCKVDLLVEYGSWILRQLLPREELAREVAMQLHGDGNITQDASQVLQALVLTLQPTAHVQGWLNGRLPYPSATTLDRAMGEMEAELCQKVLDHCGITLLAGYGLVLLQKPELKESSARLLAMRLQGFVNDAGAKQLMLDLLARVSPATQLRWWLDGDVQIDWELVRLYLEEADKVLQLEVAHVAAARHRPELLSFLPTAPIELLIQLVEVFTLQSSWQWSEDAEERGKSILVLAEQLCLRYAQEPEVLGRQLQRLRKHCMTTKWTGYRQEAFANAAIVELLVEELVSPSLTVEQQLSYWQHGLIGHFPLVPLSAIAKLVATTPKAQWYPRLRTEAGLSAELLFAWEALGSLPAKSEQELEHIAEAHSSVLTQKELLSAIVPWLEDTLATSQLEALWMWGYPVSEPTDWTKLTVLERVFTAIRFKKLNRVAELPIRFSPNEEEIWEWLAEQYWEAEHQQDASKAFGLLQRYHKLALVDLPAWEELEDELLLRCEAVVKVRLWLNQPGLDRARTFNYYGFRRGYSRLLTAEQRNFLSVAQVHLDSSFTKTLHLRRRRLLSKEDGVSVYRVSLAHCYCPQDGYLEIELADRLHTQPFAYPEAIADWNKNFLLEPWAGCPILAYVDTQSRELLQIKGLEAALILYPPMQDPEATFKKKRKRGTTNNPKAYPQDPVLHDELTQHLMKLADDVKQRLVLIEEARAKREHRPPNPEAEAEIIDGGGRDYLDDLEGVMLQPRQTVIYPVLLQEETVFVWASRFANSNQATYLFRVPALEQDVALKRLTTVLQQVGGIRSALLAPGRASHRLRRHLGYVTTIRGRRGHAQAFEQWTARLDKALMDGPSQQHPYDPASDWQMSELEKAEQELEATPPTPVTPPVPITPAAVVRASQLLAQLRILNLTFLSQYAA